MSRNGRWRHVHKIFSQEQVIANACIMKANIPPRDFEMCMGSASCKSRSAIRRHHSRRRGITQFRIRVDSVHEPAW